MNNEEFNARILKAAAVGCAQSLTNRGFNPENVVQGVDIYTNPNYGLLQKRANDRISAVKATLYNAIKGNK